MTRTEKSLERVCINMEAPAVMFQELWMKQSDDNDVMAC